MPGEKAGLARQLQNMLNAAPELRHPLPKNRLPPSQIGHENRIMNEGRVANDVGDRSEGMTRVNTDASISPIAKRSPSANR